MLEWMEEGDRMSFDDSDRFEEDSLCSWGSEPESLCNNWRGWKKPLAVSTTQGTPLLASNQRRAEDGSVLSLAELCSRVVAAHIAFEVVEQAWQPVPEPLQLRIAFWSFPDNEEDIRLYSCLANGAADEFNKGENLYKSRAVKEPLQIGFHLSASVVSPQQTAQGKLSTFNVAVTFDRRRITSCNCTCASRAFWCAHVVAVCLYRIHQSHLVTLRAPVSESLSRLQRDQLQKFAQYLISELPQQILPTAQRLLDELLSAQPSAINTVCGAPDPTAGASASEQTSWCLDENTLHENIRKILIKFCVPSPTVFSDVNYLSSTAPPAAAEWSSLLRPLRGREPEGMWNLLSIVREMFKRHDRNAVPLLEVLTEEIMSCEQIMVWWFNTKVAMHNGSAGGYGNGMKTSNLGSQSQASQHACSSLCDEVVILWRLAALNPGLSSEERELLRQQFSEWHVKVIDKVSKSKGVNSHGGGGMASGGGPSTPRRTSHSFRIEIEVFTGFKASIEACYLSWDDYPVPGVTYTQGHRLYHCPFTCFRHSETHGRIDLGQINASSAVIKNDLPVHMLQRRVVQGEYGLMLEEMQQQRESGAHHHNNNKNNGFPASPTLRPERELDRAGNRSSVSSEGFCENEGDPAAEATFEPSAMPMPSGLRDLVRQDSDDPALGSDTNEPEVLAADSCNSTDKDNKSSPEDFDADSDWSGVDARLKLGRIAAGAAMDVSASATAEPQPGPSSVNIGEAAYAIAGPSSAPIQVAQVIREPVVVTVPNRGSFGEIKPLEDPLEILFARAEGLHAHGHSAEACELGVQLASELLANPPDLLVELPPIIAKNGKKKKTNPACHQISCVASATLAKCAFLCTVLAENLDYYHLAFRVGMFGLELARPPATTKPLEVKLSHQESELVTLLKRIPLGHSELTILREKAEQLRDGILRSRGDALLPLSLATFIFEALVTASGMPQQARSSHYTTHRLPTDETLGFEAAVAALGLKANVSEADHPLLCEGTRRQRGDLSVMLLVHYKDDPDKLAKIMDKLLDRQVHPLYKAPLLSSFYTNNPTPMGHHNSTSANARHSNQMRQRREGGIDAGIAALALDSGNSTSSREANSAHPGGATGGLREQSPTWEEDYAHWQSGHSTGSEALQAEAANHGAGASGGISATGGACNRHLMSVARNRGMAHRNQRQSTGPGSDSGSSGSGKSSGSDSFGSRGPMSYPPPSCSGGAAAAAGASFSDDRLANLASHSSSASSGQHHAQQHQVIPEMGAGSSSSSSTFNRNGSTGSLSSMGASGVSGGGLGNGKVNQRFKNKRLYPSVPNQPSEASAHFMFELAKTVLLKAGGNSSTSLFTQPINSQNPRGPIRALQMCAFQIGLYALGLHNCVSAKWLSRTYSSHVSWITGQAMEIGSQALWFLISTWEGHLTPPEVASIADRASRGHEANMVRAAAELALSCLPHAHALNPNEIQRAILQCKEQSSEMLERACLAVESAAKGGGVYPEVLFCVARCWHELYEQRMPSARRGGAARLLPSVEQPPPPIPMQVPPCPMQQPQANMAGVGVPVPYPMASIVPFPLAYSFLSGTAPGPNPPAQISGVPVYLPAPAGAAGAGPNATFSYAPPIPGLQYFSSVTCPMPMGPTSGPPNPPPGPSPLMPMPSQGGNSSRPPPPMAPPGCQVSLQPLLHSSNNPTHQGPPSLYAQQPPQQPPPPTPQQQQQMQQPQLNSIRTPPSAPGPMPNQALTPVQLQLLLAAYRVGIVALETLGRRAHDDRPQARYSRNPPYGEDVKWLLSVAKKLGTEHLQQFCVVTVTSVVSPFVLHEIAVEAAHFFAYTGSGPPNPYMQHLRSRVLTPLIQKCHQMYIQCVNHKLYHLNSNDYDDFLSIVQAARSAFHLIPTGPMQFNEFLQSIQKSKSCTKELWGRLMAIVRQPAV